MKFAHMADAHIGAFSKNPALARCNINAFKKAIEICIDERVDFIIIAGDLLHNPVPDMAMVDEAVSALRRAKKQGIRIYVVYGSHDFSGGTISLLDVLSNAGLFTKAVKYDMVDGKIRLVPVTDETGVNIVGVPGLTAAREVKYFEEGAIDMQALDSIPHPKIFVFHTTVQEIKPSYIKETRAVPLSLFPPGFDYYAGGHIHERIEYEYSNSPLTYPGALFGATYNDLDTQKERGFYIVENFKTRYVPVKVCNMEKKIIKASGKTAQELYDELVEFAKKDHKNRIVILKVTGTLASGRVGDIDFHSIREMIRNTADEVLVNTYSLSSAETLHTKVSASSAEEIEHKIFAGISQYGPDFPATLFKTLSMEKKEGEKKADFEQRLWSAVFPLIKDTVSRAPAPKQEEQAAETSEKTPAAAPKKQINLFEFGDA